MKAMVLKENCEIKVEEEKRTRFDLPYKEAPLELVDISKPIPHSKEILVKISACGVCHTELDEIEGRLLPPKLPLVPGHQVVGTIEGLGPEVSRFRMGDRVGIAWIYSSCGKCKFCVRGDENLCKQFKGTGFDVNGGYGEYMTVSEDFAYPIPDCFSDSHIAPLLCAGIVGYRALRLSGN